MPSSCRLPTVTGLAARLTDTDVNPHRAVKGYVSTPGMLMHYLLVEPAMHAALVLHRHDDDAAVRGYSPATIERHVLDSATAHTRYIAAVRNS
jgi:hypothetical protein